MTYLSLNNPSKERRYNMPILLQKIKELCKEKNMTPADVERAAGLVNKTIYTWSRVIPSVDKVSRVAEVLGVTIEELLA